MFNPLNSKSLNPVYYVWRIGGNAPNVEHSSLKSAEEEARRLAELNKGCFFAVIKCIEAVGYSNDPFVVVKFSGEEVPF